MAFVDPVASFSGSYGEARRKFVDAATRAGLVLQSCRYPAAGPVGEPLTIDVAFKGGREISKWLVMVSGTHGVEGFCGSGAQIDFLRRGLAEDRLASLSKSSRCPARVWNSQGPPIGSGRRFAPSSMEAPYRRP